MNTSLNPRARTKNLVINDLPDETLVYDLDTNEAHCLNRTAAFIWKNCDGTKTPENICGLVEEQFGANVPDDFVWLALDQLNENGLLSAESQILKQNRREVIKKIGLAAVIALPMVASMVAPKNALAALSCACANPGDCLTQPSCPSTVNCNGSGICAP